MRRGRDAGSGRGIQLQVTEIDPDVIDELPRLSEALIVQFHVPVPDAKIVSPLGKLLAELNQDEAMGPDPDPDRPPGPEIVNVALPPDSSVMLALMNDSQMVCVPLPKTKRTQVTLGPSMLEIVGGRSTLALTTSGTVWPPSPLNVTFADGTEPSARLLRSRLIDISADEPGAKVPAAGERPNGPAPLALQLTGCPPGFDSVNEPLGARPRLTDNAEPASCPADGGAGGVVGPPVGFVACGGLVTRGGLVGGAAMTGPCVVGGSVGGAVVGGGTMMGAVVGGGGAAVVGDGSRDGGATVVVAGVSGGGATVVVD
jgi:hypothetical protein